MSYEKVIVRQDDLDRIEAEIKNRLNIEASLIFPDDYVSGIQNMPDVFEMIVGGDLKSYTDYNYIISDGYLMFSEIRNLNLPNVLYIGAYAFQMCYYLNSVYLPNLLSIGDSAFSDCQSLTVVSLPSVTTIGSQSFYRCTNLNTIILSSITEIGSMAFLNCSNLKNIVIKTPDRVCALSSALSLSEDGYVYVPDNLVADYQSATNWSVVASNIKPLSEYVEGM